MSVQKRMVLAMAVVVFSTMATYWGMKRFYVLPSWAAHGGKVTGPVTVTTHETFQPIALERALLFHSVPLMLTVGLLWYLWARQKAEIAGLREGTVSVRFVKGEGWIGEWRENPGTAEAQVRMVNRNANWILLELASAVYRYRQTHAKREESADK